jgi:glutaminase
MDMQGPVQDLLDHLHAKIVDDVTGDIATYIPELAKADPRQFAISLVTGSEVYGAGNCTTAFSIQSVSKPFVYALALEDAGLDEVLKHVGVEPTGDAFNSIVLEPGTGRPLNPMVNAGAIVTSTLVAGDNATERFERSLQGLSAFAGRQLDVDELVYKSEQATGDRNRAISYLMRTAGSLTADVEDALAVYFRQCSILVTSHDLSVMAATLANGGINPITSERVVGEATVGRVLTLMSTCGMYDSAGEWLFSVGLPAKSGVSGGIVAVLPGQLGLGIYSAPLDPRGNSVRGIRACTELSEQLGLHLFQPGPNSVPVVRRTYNTSLVRSKRSRTRREQAVLDERGAEVVVHELHGGLTFSTSAELVTSLLPTLGDLRALILDMRRVTHVDKAGEEMLAGLADEAVRRNVAVLAVGADRLTQRLLTRPDLHGCPDVESALESCEDMLLAEAGIVLEPPEGLVPLQEQELLAEIPEDLLAAIEERFVTKVYTPGTVVFHEGAEADSLYFICAGQMSADIRASHSSRRVRLSTMRAGTAFGELALVDGGRRSARVVVDQPSLCYVLSREAVHELETQHPRAAEALHRAIARSLSARLRRATAEIRALEG